MKNNAIPPTNVTPVSRYNPFMYCWAVNNDIEPKKRANVIKYPLLRYFRGPVSTSARLNLPQVSEPDDACRIHCYRKFTDVNTSRSGGSGGCLNIDEYVNTEQKACETSDNVMNVMPNNSCTDLSSQEQAYDERVSRTARRVRTYT